MDAGRQPESGAVSAGGGCPGHARAGDQVARELVAQGVETDLAALREVRLGVRLREFALFAVMLAGGAALALQEHWTLRVAGTLLAAAALNAVVLLLHEGMHGTLLSAPRWTRAVSTALGAMVLISFTAYQVMHLRHHRYLGDPRDPDDYDNYSRSRAVVWALHYVRLLAGAFLYLLLIPVLAWRFGAPRDRRRLALEYTLLAAVYVAAAVFVPGDLLIRGWLVPLVVVGYMTNIRGFAQHGLLDAQDPFLASRSIRPNRLVAFLLLNENLHLEHHLFPEIPSHNLPQVRALIDARLPRVSIIRSYLGFLFGFLARGWSLDATPVGVVRRNPG